MGVGHTESVDQVTPADHAFDITPNDSVDLPAPTRGIYLGTLGDLHVLTTGGSEVTFVGMNDGIIHPVRIIRVFSTGTSAGDIIGLR